MPVYRVFGMSAIGWGKSQASGDEKRTWRAIGVPIQRTPWNEHTKEERGGKKGASFSEELRLTPRLIHCRILAEWTSHQDRPRHPQSASASHLLTTPHSSRRLAYHSFCLGLSIHLLIYDFSQAQWESLSLSSSFPPLSHLLGPLSFSSRFPRQVSRHWVDRFAVGALRRLWWCTRGRQRKGRRRPRHPWGCWRWESHQRTFALCGLSTTAAHPGHPKCPSLVCCRSFCSQVLACYPHPRPSASAWPLHFPSPPSAMAQNCGLLRARRRSRHSSDLFWKWFLRSSWCIECKTWKEEEPIYMRQKKVGFDKCCTDKFRSPNKFPQAQFPSWH